MAGPNYQYTQRAWTPTTPGNGDSVSPGGGGGCFLPPDSWFAPPASTQPSFTTWQGPGGTNYDFIRGWSMPAAAYPTNFLWTEFRVGPLSAGTLSASFVFVLQAALGGATKADFFLVSDYFLNGDTLVMSGAANIDISLALGLPMGAGSVIITPFLPLSTVPAGAAGNALYHFGLFRKGLTAGDNYGGALLFMGATLQG